MARSLEGKTFFNCFCNGILAIAEERVKNNLVKIKAVESTTDSRLIGKLAHMPDIPVFTFCELERFKTSPWITAPNDLFQKLDIYIKNSGGYVDSAFFYV